MHDPRDGRAAIWKESTTPDDPARGAMMGTRRVLAQGGRDARQVGRVVHATTLFTNALIERKGAKTGLITTAGFRDVLEIGRERKYELYDIFIEMPKPLVPRPWRREAPERLAPDGTVEIPLDLDAALAEVAALVEQGVESLAICFLHAYANPAHERAIGAAVAKRFPDLSISLSSDIAPEIREYPRASTTVANAYVRPLAESYLERLEQALRERGIPAGSSSMLSNGGLTHVSEAKRAPVQLLESGPAAGRAGRRLVRPQCRARPRARLRHGRHDGQAGARRRRRAAGRLGLRGGAREALPARQRPADPDRHGRADRDRRRRRLDRAQVASSARSRSGRRAAARSPARPATAAAARKPTVTDADLALGYLNADFFLGGAMRIDRAATEAAFGRLAKTLGRRGRPRRLRRARRGEREHGRRGPRRHRRARPRSAEYALLATGGAGPVHAWHVARKLGINRVVCPPGAGAGSTIGMLMAPARVDRVASFNAALAGATSPPPTRIFAALEKEAMEVLRAPAPRSRLAPSAASPTCAISARAARSPSRCPSRSPRPACSTAFETAYKRCSAARRRVRPSSSWRCGSRSPRRCRARRRAGAAAPSLGRSAEGHAAGLFRRRRRSRRRRSTTATRLPPAPRIDGPAVVRGEREHLRRRPRRHGAPAARRIHPRGGR